MINKAAMLDLIRLRMALTSGMSPARADADRENMG